MGSLRHGTTVGNSGRPATLTPGHSGWASTLNGIENPRRIAIPNTRALGLEQPWWLCIDIGDHIGWVDQGFVFDVAKLAGLNGPTIKTPLLAALVHHGPSASPLLVADGAQP